MASTIELPYEISRTWPEDWDLLPLFKGSRTSPCEGPARFLHPGVEVRLVPGRGRGIVATQSLEAGALVLLDSPLMTATGYEELFKAAHSKTGQDADFRRQLLSMCGDPGDEDARSDTERAPSEMLVRNIVRHNYHAIEQPPADGDIAAPSSPPVGLWPLGSIVNHSLRPNVARSFAGHASCYRLIRPIAQGDEVLDNYLDLRLPHAMRQEMMRSNHGIDDEGPDALDAPADAVKEIQASHAKSQKLLKKGSLKSSQAAFKDLADISNRIVEIGVADPCFTDIFRDFGIVVGRLGDADMSLDGFAKALEHATTREPFNVISCVLTLRMLHIACLAPEDVNSEIRQDLVELARKHYRIVYGPWPGLFEVLNPELAQTLSSLAQQGGADEEAKEPEPKRKRAE